MSANLSGTDRIAALLRAYEESLLQPEFRRDRPRVAALLAEDFEEVGASGQHWDRAEVLDLLAAENYHPPALQDFQCVLLADQVALVTYATVRQIAGAGKPAQSLRSSIWVLEQEGWKLRFHQGTPAA